MIKDDSKQYQCPLCGYRFNKNEAEQACTACPLKSNCEVICCPHCRYQFIIESKVLSWVRKFKERKASSHENKPGTPGK